ncbi:heavy-metal-associated domain-containing protein [Winogradskyella litoriviva]|uniref:Heavy-metal-associated domain-containing protein n=1 Tax=Winogradskyella litoriviva TaxID=1220182 RepID=A0ABX2E933_9FLAO|nr:heavy metal-associated domain-containing protein [Winogradskyella litoriviva]NRD24606.1 heavy-metal-associated domain-containing protein [Winogradskyella litoriviva]
MRSTVHLRNLESCGNASIIENALSKLKNISEVVVDFKNETVAFNFHTKHDFEHAKHVLEMLGYPIRGAENKLKM